MQSVAKHLCRASNSNIWVSIEVKMLRCALHDVRTQTTKTHPKAPCLKLNK